MTHGHFILVDGKVKHATLMEWAKWMENAPNRTVEKTMVGDAQISTVFLGLDHNFGEGPPLLFETMVFGGEMDQECRRYATLGEAKAGHFELVDTLKAKVS